MNSVAAIGLSGMRAAQAALAVSGHNIANGNTTGFRRQEALRSDLASGGVDAQVVTAARSGPAIETDMVGLLQAKHAFLANLAVFRRHDEMMGTLLDLRG